jgi:hypothetical protein
MTDVEEDRSRPGDANGQRPPVEQPALPSVPNKPPLTRSLSKMPKDQRTSRERLSWCVTPPPPLPLFLLLHAHTAYLYKYFNIYLRG